MTPEDPPSSTQGSIASDREHFGPTGVEIDRGL